MIFDSNSKCVLEEEGGSLYCVKKQKQCSDAKDSVECSQIRVSNDKKRCFYLKDKCIEQYKTCEDYEEAEDVLDKEACESIVIANDDLNKCVFTAGVDYVSYDEGCKQGYKVSTYVAHDLDQDFEFYSKVPGLYSIEWSGYGAWEYYQASYKKCYYHIRVCYHTCGDCDSTTQGDSNNHRCIKCKGSRYFKHGTKNCYSRDEIDDGYHYDENTNEWVNCYKTCGRCSKAGNETNPYCITCSKNFPYLINGGKCVNNTDGYYYENCTGKWVKCHDRCSKCRRGGSDSRHNCDVCAPGYIFWKVDSFCSSFHF